MNKFKLTGTRFFKYFFVYIVVSVANFIVLGLAIPPRCGICLVLSNKEHDVSRRGVAR